MHLFGIFGVGGPRDRLDEILDDRPASAKLARPGIFIGAQIRLVVAWSIDHRVSSIDVVETQLRDCLARAIDAARGGPLSD